MFEWKPVCTYRYTIANCTQTQSKLIVHIRMVVVGISDRTTNKAAREIFVFVHELIECARIQFCNTIYLAHSMRCTYWLMSRSPDAVLAYVMRESATAYNLFSNSETDWHFYYVNINQWKFNDNFTTLVVCLSHIHQWCSNSIRAWEWMCRLSYQKASLSMIWPCILSTSVRFYFLVRNSNNDYIDYLN